MNLPESSQEHNIAPDADERLLERGFHSARYREQATELIMRWARVRLTIATIVFLIALCGMGVAQPSMGAVTIWLYLGAMAIIGCLGCSLTAQQHLLESGQRTEGTIVHVRKRRWPLMAELNPHLGKQWYTVQYHYPLPGGGIKHAAMQVPEYVYDGTPAGNTVTVLYDTALGASMIYKFSACKFVPLTLVPIARPLTKHAKLPTVINRRLESSQGQSPAVHKPHTPPPVSAD